MISSYVIFNQKRTHQFRSTEAIGGLSMLSKEIVNDGRKKTIRQFDILLSDFENLSLRNDTIATSGIKKKKQLDQLRTRIVKESR